MIDEQTFPKHAQSGQAAVEALILMLVLGTLWAGIAWLGRIQDIALQATHASRYAAFSATRHDHMRLNHRVVDATLHGRGNQWSDRRGAALLHSVYQNIDVSFLRHKAKPSDTPIGGPNPRVAQLREDWLDTDEGVLSAYIRLVPWHDTPERDNERSLLGLDEFDAAYPTIVRHTSILTGAGHASDDVSAADRVANSWLAWSGPAGQSYRLGRRVASVGTNVDAAWNRPDPVFDWLRPWSEYVPSHHLDAQP